MAGEPIHTFNLMINYRNVKESTKANSLGGGLYLLNSYMPK
ncbi:MAG: hypothetical protein ACYCXO_06955 [Candidatus Humimicrobiaceae bacterium]